MASVSLSSRVPPEGVSRRTALVTGSSSGIGIAIARQLGHDGFNVGLTRMPQEDPTAVENLAQQLRNAYGVEAEIFITDLSYPDTACSKLVDEHVDRFGRLDVLVNNAGWAAFAGKKFMDLHEDNEVKDGGDDADIAHILHKFRTGFAVNFEAGMVLSWKAVNQFRKQSPPDPNGSERLENDPDLDRGFYTAQWGTGRIINITSVHAESPLPRSSVYTTAKHATRGLTVFLASELGPEGVTVNAIGPGLIATPQTEIDPDDVESESQYKHGLFVPRPGRPSEAAAAVGFFASLGGRYTTAQSLYTDGGFLTTNPQFFGMQKRD